MISRAKKEALRAEAGDRFNKAGAALVAEYRGLTVAELTELRTELRKVGAEFKVTKNRVLKKAIELDAEGSTALSDKLVGPVGVLYLYEDVAAGAKVAVEFAKSHEKFVVTGGIMDGAAVTEGDIKAISDLPSKEVLLGQIVGSLVAPHRGLLGVLNGVTRNLVQVINAIKDTKQ